MSSPPIHSTYSSHTHDIRNQRCIDACIRCVVAVEHCAAAFLAREEPGFAAAIAASRDCADVCALTARLLARRSGLSDALCRLCVAACEACALECEKHIDIHTPCRASVDSCRECAAQCGRVLDGSGERANREPT